MQLAIHRFHQPNYNALPQLLVISRFRRSKVSAFKFPQTYYHNCQSYEGKSGSWLLLRHPFLIRKLDCYHVFLYKSCLFRRVFSTLNICKCWDVVYISLDMMVSILTFLNYYKIIKKYIFWLFLRWLFWTCVLIKYYFTLIK